MSNMNSQVSYEEVDIICARLLDSEEHAVDSAIPQVAEDAVEMICKLVATLKSSQSALSELKSFPF